MTATDVLFTRSTDDADWDQNVAGLPGGTVYQTSMWAAAKGVRIRPLRVEAAIAGGAGRAYAQVLIRRVGPLATAAYVPYGPLYTEPPTTEAEAAKIVDAIEAGARSSGCAVVLVQPARGDHVTAAALSRLGFRQAPIDVATPCGLEVDLRCSEDQLFARLSKSRRQNVRRARRRGVTIESGRRTDLSTLVRLSAASARRHGFLPMTLPYLQRQWDALHPGGHVELLLAKLDGRTVAAGTMIGFGELAEFKQTGWDGSDRARASYVNDALNWSMMCRAKAAGHRVFELGGLPRDLALKATELGLDRALQGTGSEFKNGWGGTLAIHPPTFQKILNPIGHLTYRLPVSLLDNNGWGGRLVNWVRRT